MWTLLPFPGIQFQASAERWTAKTVNVQVLWKIFLQKRMEIWRTTMMSLFAPPIQQSRKTEVKYVWYVIFLVLCARMEGYQPSEEDHRGPYFPDAFREVNVEPAAYFYPHPCCLQPLSTSASSHLSIQIPERYEKTVLPLHSQSLQDGQWISTYDKLNLILVSRWNSEIFFWGLFNLICIKKSPSHAFAKARFFVLQSSIAGRWIFAGIAKHISPFGLSVYNAVLQKLQVRFFLTLLCGLLWGVS